MFCKAPFTGLTIDPAGWIVMCCNTGDREQFGVKITDVEDLNEFFRDQQYQRVRNTISKEGFEAVPECWRCTKAIQNNMKSEVHNYDRYTPSKDLTIKYLEVTTSNVCNQTCAMCTSYFSTKWRKIERHMPEWAQENHPTFAMSDASIEKILRVIPGLDFLNIKGGEPFADKNNLKILTKAAETNPDCEIIITSNFQNIPDEWFEPLSKLKKLCIGASIDGVGKTYDWIRGGNFENTYANILKFKEKTGAHVGINMCTSIYNLYNLKETQEFFEGYSQNFYNVVITPPFLSPNLIDPIKLKKLLLEQYDYDIRNISSNLWNIDPVEEYIKNQMRERFFEYTEALNKVRGFNIFDVHRQLYDIFK